MSEEHKGCRYKLASGEPCRCGQRAPDGSGWYDCVGATGTPGGTGWSDQRAPDGSHYDCVGPSGAELIEEAERGWQGFTSERQELP